MVLRLVSVLIRLGKVTPINSYPGQITASRLAERPNYKTTEWK